jgi:hypothetical protein
MVEEEGKTGRYIGELFTKRRLPLPQTHINSGEKSKICSFRWQKLYATLQSNAEAEKMKTVFIFSLRKRKNL